MTAISYWLSTESMTVEVLVENGIVKEAAPIVQRFKGQPLFNLINWMKKQKGFRYCELRKAACC